MAIATQRRRIVEAPEEIPGKPNYDHELIQSGDEPQTGHGNGADLNTCSAAQAGAAGFEPLARMVIKRSLSPDGHIDSVSVQIDLAIEGLSAQEIKAKGIKALGLEMQIIQDHLASLLPPQPLSLVRPKTADTSGNGNAETEAFAAPARLLDIGKTKNNHYFINVKVGSKTAKLFGSPVQLVKHLAGIGQSLTPAAISEGQQLDFSCRAITKLSDDGRYLNVVRLLPAA